MNSSLEVTYRAGGGSRTHKRLGLNQPGMPVPVTPAFSQRACSSLALTNLRLPVLVSTRIFWLTAVAD